MPPAIARALNELTMSEGHSVVSLRETFPANSADIDCVTHLKKEGGWAVVSQDKFTKADAHRRAVRECGKPNFCLATQSAK
ncbi:PIN-like domain-containing protein, partial [Pseudomonas syringae group genomosp. 7]